MSKRFGKKRVADCSCTYNSTCRACLNKAGPTRRWIEAFYEPECFYCGKELPFNEVTADELPQERICQRCHDKVAEEEGLDL